MRKFTEKARKLPFIPKKGLASCGRLLFWNTKEACIGQVSHDDVPAMEVCTVTGGWHYISLSRIKGWARPSKSYGLK
jgi:hypothetical protein